MSKLDLHIHSSYSDDGELSPREIVARSHAAGMELIAIADHNSVSGVPEALAAAGSLRVIPGVELDCIYGGRGFHLLGYGFDHTTPVFREIERDILRQEQLAGPEKLELLRRATRLPVDSDAVLAAAQNGIVTGELVAQLLLARPDAAHYPLLRPYLPGGEKSDMPNVRFYWDYFSQGKPAYWPIRYLSLREAVQLLHGAGGLAVLAHPGQNLGEDDSLLAGILTEGVDGLEAFSSYHSDRQVERYLEAAQQHRLLVTCGSDFHGHHKPHIQLGGHHASWDDATLKAGLTQRLGLSQ